MKTKGMIKAALKLMVSMGMEAQLGTVLTDSAKIAKSIDKIVIDLELDY